MTRKKQDAPKKLNGELDKENVKTEVNKTAEDNSEKAELVESADKTSSDCDLSEVSQPSPAGQPLMDSSCEKLLAFTMDFITNKANSLKSIDFKQNRESTENKTSGALLNRSVHSPDILRISSVSPKNENVFNHDTKPALSNKPQNAASLANNLSPILTGIDKLPFKDTASLTAARCVMDAMLQQQQFYEQCSSNWINVQRTDNNCLSKSKAERYRWCVQGNNHKLPRTANGSHVPTLKKPVTSVGSVQDKLFSTVFAGASKFNCRDCGSSFNTLVELTVHMNQTGHFRDKNMSPPKLADENWLPNVNKAKKRNSVDEDSNSEKVLTCMGCGGLFDSLQDLSVHMIKTKHYEKVPSWRMWSPKQEPTNENVSRRKPASHSSQNTEKKTEAATDFSALLNSPYYFPYIGVMNNPAAAAYASSLLYSSPWMSPFLPSMLNSIYPLPLRSSFLSSSSDPNIRCGQCLKPFTSLQELTAHIKETSHFQQNPSRPTSPSNHESANRYSDSGILAPVSSGAEVNCKTTDPVEDQNGGFDFIKSLESTIQSAISKVEGPRNIAAPKSFSPFTSSLNTDFVSQSTNTNSNKSPSAEHSCKTSPSCETPLDLTVKRDERHPVRDSIAAYSGSSPSKDPLESLKENMNSLFSPKPEAKKSDYKPLVDDKLSSNPLKEMLRIVHNTTSGRKRASSDTEPDPKKQKTLDLVKPGVSPVSNPIQQIQELVDKKLTTSQTYSRPVTSSKTPIASVSVTSPSSTCSHVTSLCAFVTSSRFLPHNGCVNGDDMKTVTTSRSSDVSQTCKTEKLTTYQEILLHRCYAHLMTSKTQSRPQSPSDDAVVAIASTIGLPSRVVKDWLKRANDNPPFIRTSGDKREVICSFCRPHLVFSDATELADHLQRHLDPTVASTQQKIHFQGSMCFSTFRKNVPLAETNDIDVTSQISNDVKDFRKLRCVDETTSADDVIRVTG